MKTNVLLLLCLLPMFLSAQVFTQLADVNGTIYSTAQHGNITIIGGKFSSVNGTTANNIAWSIDQINWFAIGNGINDTVKDIKYFNGDFFICGAFTMADTQANNFIVRWSPVTHLFKAVKNNQNYTGTGISHLQVVDTLLFACGLNWAIPNVFGYNQGARSAYVYNPSFDTSFQNNALFPFYHLYACNMTTDGSNLYVYSTDFTNYYMQVWNGATWTWLANSAYPQGYVPVSMQCYNSSIYTSNGISGILVWAVNNGGYSTFSTHNASSMMVANGKLWFADSAVYTSTGAGSQRLFSTNGHVYSMMADSNYYFAGKFDSINGAIKKDFVKYKILTPVLAIASLSDSMICAGHSVNFTNLSTGSSPAVSWLFPGGNPSSGSSNSETVTYTNRGVYRVTMIVSNPISADSIHYNIYVGNTISLSAPMAVSYCKGKEDTIQVNGLAGLNGTFHWFPMTGISNNANSFAFDSTASQSYMIYANDYGCADTVRVAVTIFPIPALPTVSQLGNELLSDKTTGNQWYFNATKLIDSTTQALLPSQNGSYIDVYTDDNGCSSSSGQFNYVQTVGIEKINDPSIFKVYPNPTADFLYANARFELFDDQGRVIGYYDAVANLQGLADGTYYVVSGKTLYRIIKK